MSTFIPLGPPAAKKPRPKKIKFVDDLYGYISCDEELTTGTELYAWSEAENDFLLVESGTYTTDGGPYIIVVDGVIQ